MGKIKNISVAGMNTLAGKFAKSVDFYYWKGIPCFRRMPTIPPPRPGSDRYKSAQAFKEVAQRKARMPSLLKEHFKRFAAGSTETWGDVFTRWQMAYFKGTGKLPPEILDFKLTYGSGLVVVYMILAYYAELAIFWMISRNYNTKLKMYRGTEVICHQRDAKKTDKGIKIPIKVTGYGPWKTGTWNGFSRSYSKLNIRKPPCEAAAILMAGFNAAPEVAPTNTICREYIAMTNGTSIPRQVYGGAVSVARIAKNLALDIPTCWTWDQVNGIRMYVELFQSEDNEDRRFSIELTGMTTFLEHGLNGNYYLTIPFSPSGTGTNLLNVTPFGYNNPNDPNLCIDWPYPEFYNATFKILKYRFTKGPRAAFSFEFDKPWEHNTVIEIIEPYPVEEENPIDRILDKYNYVPIVDWGGTYDEMTDEAKEEYDAEVDASRLEDGWLPSYEPY